MQREDGAGWEVLYWLDKLYGMELLLLLAECQGMDLWLQKRTAGSMNCLFRSNRPFQSPNRPAAC